MKALRFAAELLLPLLCGFIVVLLVHTTLEQQSLNRRIDAVSERMRDLAVDLRVAEAIRAQVDEIRAKIGETR